MNKRSRGGCGCSCASEGVFTLEATPELYNRLPVNAASLDRQRHRQRLLPRKAPLTDSRLFYWPMRPTLSSRRTARCHAVFIHFIEGGRHFCQYRDGLETFD